MQDMKPFTAPYHSGWDSRVKNTESIPAGSGAKFLRCMIAHNGDLVAASWHRKAPRPETGYMVFTFPKH